MSMQHSLLRDVALRATKAQASGAYSQPTQATHRLKDARHVYMVCSHWFFEILRFSGHLAQEFWLGGWPQGRDA